MRLGWLVVALLLLVGCGRIQNERFTGAAEAASAISIEVEALPTTAVVGSPDELAIIVRRDNEPIEGASVQVEGNMTHAGMEPLFVQATETAPGDYRAAIEWTMGGEWFLRVRATLPDGTTAEETFTGIQVEAR
jgi:hypothetical protein